VIWLVLRRYRALIAITVVLLAGLGVWMLLLGHASDAAESSFACREGTFACHTRSGVFSLSDQVTATNLLLLFVPCLLGIVFGAPLVAGELEHYTNRLAWTQGISRTKWLIVKWCAIGLILLVIVAALTVITQWWTGHAGERQDPNLFLTGKSRLQPLYFPITGLAMSAYTLFAFALGAAFGAVLRKTSWAIVGTVVIYTAISVLVVLLVRPSLAPQRFHPIHESASGQGVGDKANVISESSWNLGFGYRYIPGVPRAQAGPAANAVGQRCQMNYTTATYLSCLSDHQIQMGTFYQPASRYWELQWRESALLVVAAGALFGVTVWSVRRWRA
jgi:hypothetical protein